MSIAREQTETTNRVRLIGSIDIGAAEDLKQALLDALASQRDVLIAMDEVTYLDVTAVQLLWAGQRAAEEQCKALLFDRIPETVRQTLGDVGLEEFPSGSAGSQPTGEIV